MIVGYTSRIQLSLRSSCKLFYDADLLYWKRPYRLFMDFHISIQIPMKIDEKYFIVPANYFCRWVETGYKYHVNTRTLDPADTRVVCTDTYPIDCLPVRRPNSSISRSSHAYQWCPLFRSCTCPTHRRYPLPHSWWPRSKSPPWRSHRCRSPSPFQKRPPPKCCLSAQSRQRRGQRCCTHSTLCETRRLSEW